MAYLTLFGASVHRRGSSRRARRGPTRKPHLRFPFAWAGRRPQRTCLRTERSSRWKGKGEARLAKYARVPAAGPMGDAEGQPGRLRPPMTASPATNTTPTAMSGRPRRFAREIVGNASTALSAATSSPGPRPPRSSSASQYAFYVEPQRGPGRRIEWSSPANWVTTGPTDPGDDAHPERLGGRPFQPDGVPPTRARTASRRCGKGSTSRSGGRHRADEIRTLTGSRTPATVSDPSGMPTSTRRRNRDRWPLSKLRGHAARPQRLVRSDQARQISPRVTFDADSGLGEGSSSEAYFQVGDDE